MTRCFKTKDFTLIYFLKTSPCLLDMKYKVYTEVLAWDTVYINPLK
jgi:hypothetical protein